LEFNSSRAGISGTIFYPREGGAVIEAAKSFLAQARVSKKPGAYVFRFIQSFGILSAAEGILQAIRLVRD
jgi:hypothetical protein